MLKLFKEIVNNENGWGLPETVISTIVISAMAVAALSALRTPANDTVTSLGTKLKSAVNTTGNTAPTW